MNKIIDSGEYCYDLARQCEEKGNPDCCIESVNIMRGGNYYKPNESATCGEGFTLNALRCKDSFSWCESINK